MSINEAAATLKHEHEHKELMDGDQGDNFLGFLAAVKEQWALVQDRPLFLVYNGHLYDTFLNHLPADRRQHYSCDNCRDFVNTHGGIVTIDPETGRTTSALWADIDVPTFFVKSVEAMRREVEKGAVIYPFFTDTEEPNLGKATSVSGRTGINWNHLHVPVVQRFVSRIKTAYTHTAGLREDHRNIARAVKEFHLTLTQTAVDILNTVDLQSPELVLGPANFLNDLNKRLEGVHNEGLRSNIIWAAVVRAPDGFKHPRSSTIGNLLEQLENGMSIEQIRRSFNKKMEPGVHGVKLTAPTEGAVLEAEKLITKLGVTESLKRRYATLDDMLQIAWRPAPPQPQKGRMESSIFGNIKVKADQAEEPLAVTQTAARSGRGMTYAKFARDILPSAVKIEVNMSLHQVFAAFTTAVDPDAPPIFSWDSHDPGQRNALSWYIYPRGSDPRDWNMGNAQWVECTAIVKTPWTQGQAPTHLDENVIFILKDCRDMLYEENPGLGLFQMLLRSELHPASRVIDAYTKSKAPDGWGPDNACGRVLANGLPMIVIVTSASGIKSTHVLNDID